MPYVLSDDDFEMLSATLNKLSATEKLTLEGRTVLTMLLIVLAHITKVEDGKPLDLGKVISVTSPAFASLLQHLSNEVGGVIVGETNGVPWFFADELAPEACGFIPSFLHVDDERPMIEQINERYIGGWHPFKGFQLRKKSWTIVYPDDPDIQPIAGAALHGEVIAVFPYAWVMIVKSDNSWEIARMD